MLKKVTLTTLMLLILIYIGICYTLSNRVLTPNSSLERTKARIQSSWGTSFEELMVKMPEAKDLRIQGFEGVPISGKYFEVSDTAKCAIIFIHGWSGTWAGMLKYAPVFEDCGCQMIFYDHRVHGESGGEYPTGGIKEKEDLWAVTKWVANKYDLGYDQIGWAGASWGAATALQAAAINEDVGFVLADASYQDWYSTIFERAIRDYGVVINVLTPGVMAFVNWRTGIDYKDASPILAASHITEPVLLIHSRTDTQTSSEQSVNISKKLNASSEFHHLDWGNDHTADVWDSKDQFAQLVSAFMKKRTQFPFECN